MGLLFKTLDDLQSRMDGFLINGFCNPIRVFVKNDIQTAQLAKKNYDNAQSEYDVKSTTLNDMKKKGAINNKTLQKSEGELTSLKQSCEQAELDSKFKLQDCMKKNEYHTSELLCNLYEAFTVLFGNCTSAFTARQHTFQESRSRIVKLRNDHDEQKGRRPSINVFKPNMQKSAIYGVPLDIVFRQPCVRTCVGSLPVFLHDIISEIHQNHLNVEGLFRISASREQLKTYKVSIDQGNKVDMSNLEGHTVAGLLTMWLRELPEPLCTTHMSPFFFKIVDDDLDYIQTFSKIVRELPPNNRVVLHHLIHLLVEIASRSDKNKMGPNNLAIVVGPNLFSVPSSLMDMTFFDKANKLVEDMILHYQELFSTEPSKDLTEILPQPINPPTTEPNQTPPLLPSNTDNLMTRKYSEPTINSGPLARVRSQSTRNPNNRRTLFDLILPNFPTVPDELDSEEMTPVTKGVGAVRREREGGLGMSSSTSNLSMKGPPVWQHDHATNHCTICTQTFSLVNRKHHCRYCGQVVCGNCSNQRVDIPQWNMKAVRICPNCFKTVFTKKAATPNPVPVTTHTDLSSTESFS
eukprot:TRINITY_DN10384_c0_g1_i1.p1 TRINITY_DN10384_c0_g1~~TRINITY_DN10384_c0_g1_i1.p1  ORF type:complete len:678 (-),score=105.84 TRINITY_DN10384_c0_g1_i1:121-1851(-)